MTIIFSVSCRKTEKKLTQLAFEERVGGQTPLTDFLVEMKTPGVKDAHAGLLDAGLAFFKAGKKCVPKSLRNSHKIPLI